MSFQEHHNLNKRHIIYPILLIIQICIFLLLNILWEYNSYIMPFSESSIHMQYVSELNHFNAQNLIKAPYPNLIHYLTSPLLNYFIDEKWAYFYTSTVFVCLNVIFTYLCIASLCSEKTAFFGATALLWLPLTIIACKTYTLDYPLAAILTLWFLCFLKSKRFSKIIPSISFTVLIFVLSLIKYSYFTFIIPCCIGMAYHLFNNGRSDNLKRKHMVASALFLAFAAFVFFLAAGSLA